MEIEALQIIQILSNIIFTLLLTIFAGIQSYLLFIQKKQNLLEKKSNTYKYFYKLWNSFNSKLDYIPNYRAKITYNKDYKEFITLIENIKEYNTYVKCYFSKSLSNMQDEFTNQLEALILPEYALAQITSFTIEQDKCDNLFDLYNKLETQYIKELI